MGQMLSPLDTAFLAMESEVSPIQVGGLHIYKIPEGYDGHFVADLLEELRAQKPTTPFNRKVNQATLPYRFPRWEEDKHFDIDHHLRHLAIPAPGTMEQLTDLVSGLHSIKLDLTRPLWEFYLIEGLEGNRFAMYSKAHHAMIDGMAAMNFLDAFLSEDPNNPTPQAPWAPPVRKKKKKKADKEAPRAGRLRKMLSTGTAIVEQTRAAGSAGWDLARQTLAGQGFGKGDGFPGPFEAPRSPLNVKITQGRRFGTRELPLAEMKALGREINATLNDMILAVCAGCLRHWMIERGTLPTKPMVASMPVSVRLEGQQGDGGNQIAYILCNLATNVAEPLNRLQLIVESTEQAKQHIKEMEPATARSMAMLGNTLTLLLKETNTTNLLSPPANLIISNVPGPRYEGYLMGAKLEEIYPLSVLVDGQAMNITIMSYLDKLEFGIMGDREAFPDLSKVPGYLEKAWRELKKAIENR